MRIIGGLFKSRTLVAPKSTATRPSLSMLRETLFNICRPYIEEALFLDLFAGSGAIGLEAISRGAKNAVFVDNSRESIKSIDKNIESLNIKDQTRVIFGDVLKQVKAFSNFGKEFDIIFADPPYDYPETEELIKLIDTSSLLRPKGHLFLETEIHFQFPENLISLELKRTKTFGKTALHEFTRMESK